MQNQNQQITLDDRISATMVARDYQIYVQLDRLISALYFALQRAPIDSRMPIFNKLKEDIDTYEAYKKDYENTYQNIFERMKRENIRNVCTTCGNLNVDTCSDINCNLIS